MGEKKLAIRLAKNAGFCMGVRRALKLTLRAAHDPANPQPIATAGPLIHNRQVLEVLEGKGVRAMDENAGAAAGTAIIRAHGIGPGDYERLSAHCERIVDATCPHVHKVQEIAKKYSANGYQCIVVGDRGHAEVDGVLECAGERGVVVSRVEDVDALGPADKVVVVAQTTQDEEVFARVIEKIKQKYPDCEVFDTICRSTRQRQSEAKELAEQVDAMVVVGGFHSANTCRLAQICSAAGTPTFHVETEQGLDLDRLLQYSNIGITAGASTPHWMIRRVLRRIGSEHHRRQRSVQYLMRLILGAPIRTNVFIGGGAAAMTFVNSRLIPLTDSRLGHTMALAFFFVLSQHLLHQYSKRAGMYVSDPDRGEFFRANGGVLWWLGASSCALAAFLAFLLGWLPFVLVLAGTGAGLLYGFQFGRGLWRRLHIRRLEQLPGSKALFVGLAWAVTTALLPVLTAGGLAEHWRGLTVTFLFSFLLAFGRTLLTDLRDVEGDQLVGRETLAGLLGEKGCKRVLVALLAAEAVLLVVVGGLLNWTSNLSYVMLMAVAYSASCFLLFHKGKLPETELGEALIDGKFYACGLLALLWHVLPHGVY